MVFNIFIAITAILDSVADVNKKIENQLIVKKNQSIISKDKYNSLTIEKKVVFLKIIGYSKDEVKEKLKSHIEYRLLIKDGFDRFDDIYNKE